MTKTRNTPAKQIIYSILSEDGSMYSGEMIEKQLNSQTDDTPNRSTIYRILNGFCNEGLAHKTISDEGIAYYALCETCDNSVHHHDHIHFQCLGCDKIECLEENTKLSLPKGYKMQEANLWIKGLCPQCA